MMEVGPYRVDGQNLRLQNGSWDEYANLLFVDQPVGTGFSYVDTDSYLHELDESTNHLIVFLEKFFKIFPEHATDAVSLPMLFFIHRTDMSQLYIAGESYAGQYIPYIAKAILERNKAHADKWNLQGLLIGNGWIAPKEQYLSYLPFAYKENLLQPGTDEAKAVEQQQTRCLESLSKDGAGKVNNNFCEGVLSEILRITSTLLPDNQCYNMYDVRKLDSYSSCGMNWPPDLKEVVPYLQRTDVVKALHINEDKKTGWRECNNQVGSKFGAAHSTPAINFLPAILAELEVVLFSGDKDLICNHLGTEELINGMTFNNGTGFEVSPGVTAPKLDWTFDGEPAGTYQSARNLTYVVFYNASHMVPFDWPERSRDMLDRFMKVDYSLAGGSKPLDSAIDGLQGQRNATQDEKQRLEDARWDAYYRSGEVALVVVIAAAALWAWFVLRARRRAGYKTLFGGDEGNAPGMGLLRPGSGLPSKHRDLEAADFDEAELDDLGPRRGKPVRYEDRDEEHFGVGEDSDDDVDGEEEAGTERANGHGHK